MNADDVYDKCSDPRQVCASRDRYDWLNTKVNRFIFIIETKRKV